MGVVEDLEASVAELYREVEDLRDLIERQDSDIDTLRDRVAELEER